LLSRAPRETLPAKRPYLGVLRVKRACATAESGAGELKERELMESGISASPDWVFVASDAGSVHAKP